MVWLQTQYCQTIGPKRDVMTQIWGDSTRVDDSPSTLPRRSQVGSATFLRPNKTDATRHSLLLGCLFAGCAGSTAQNSHGCRGFLNLEAPSWLLPSWDRGPHADSLGGGSLLLLGDWASGQIQLYMLCTPTLFASQIPKSESDSSWT